MRRFLPILALIYWASSFALVSNADTPDLIANKPELSAALSESKIKVDVDFSGTRITLFAVSDQWDNPSVTFAVALVGPQRPYTITHHTKNNKERFVFVSAPAILSVATEAGKDDIETAKELNLANINPRYSAMPEPDNMNDPKLEYWRQAFADLKTQKGLFNTNTHGLQRLDGGLIRADIDLPAAAPPGMYDVRILLFQDDTLLAETQTPLLLERKGVENALFTLSLKHPIIYGFLAVLLGCSVGIGAAFLGGGRR